jgi:hypothetical protein
MLATLTGASLPNPFIDTDESADQRDSKAAAESDAAPADGGSKPSAPSGDDDKPAAAAPKPTADTSSDKDSDGDTAASGATSGNTARPTPAARR